MSNLVRTMLVPEALVSTVQNALQSFPETDGMFVIPCYTFGTSTLSYYVSCGSVSSEVIEILNEIEGVDVSMDDIPIALERLNLSLSSMMPEEV